MIGVLHACKEYIVIYGILWSSDAFKLPCSSCRLGMYMRPHFAPPMLLLIDKYALQSEESNHLAPLPKKPRSQMTKKKG